jgi:hypothetical protein
MEKKVKDTELVLPNSTITLPKTRIAYKKEYCEQLIKFMSNGYSFSAFGGEIGIGRRTLFDWAERHPEFKEASEAGQMAAQRYIEHLARIKMLGKDVEGVEVKKMDTALIIFFLKTRFRKDYTEKTELELSGNNMIQLAYKLEGKDENGK